MPSPHDFIPLQQLPLIIGRELTPAELAERDLLGDVIYVNDSCYIARSAIKEILAAQTVVRAHTRFYPPGRHKTLSGHVFVSSHLRRCKSK